MTDPVPAKYHTTQNALPDSMDMGRLVLSPTRTYAPVVTRILREVGDGISAG